MSNLKSKEGFQEVSTSKSSFVNHSNLSDSDQYKALMSVNGRYEFEGSWGLAKRLLTIPFLVWVYFETFVIMVVLKVVFSLLPVSELTKKDMRLWPASLLFCVPSTGARFAKRNSMTWQAIEFIYNWDKNTSNLGWFDSTLTKFWGGFENIVATRNRFRNLKRELFWEIDRLIQLGKNISIVSLAGGSVRGPIEISAYFLRQNPKLLKQFTIHLVDNDPKAYKFAKELAMRLYPGLEKQITYTQMTISSKKEGLIELVKLLEGASPDITEMVGFHDYMSRDKAIKVNGAIREAIPQDALFITNNVAPNIERVFIELIASWKMVNRTESEIMAIMHEVGFTKVRTVWEPTAIQTVFTCRK